MLRLQRIGGGEPGIEFGQGSRACGGFCRPVPGETGSKETGFAAEEFLGLRHTDIERAGFIWLDLLAGAQIPDPVAGRPAGLLGLLAGLVLGLSPGDLPGRDGFVQSCSGIRPRLYLGGNPVCRWRMEFGVGRLVDEIYQISARSVTMKLTVKIAALVLLAMLVFVPMRPAAAKGPSFDGQVIFGQSFTLKNGETLTGDLLVFGGTATLEEGALVTGNVVLFGGSLVVNGAVSGDVAVTGGSVIIGSFAHIHGNLTTIGASLERAEGAQIDGEIFNTATSWVGTGDNGNFPVTPTNPVTPVVPVIRFNFDPIGRVLNTLGQALSLAVLAMLVMLFLAPHAGRVAHAVMVQPLTAVGLGLLTVIVAPILLILLTVTIILIPVAAAAAIALFVAAVFGWIAIGYEIGQRFTTAIHQNWHPAFSAGLGVFTLTLVADALAGIPVLNCVGWLVPFLLGLAGFGAVIMTRFGTQAVVAPAALEPAPLAPIVPIVPIAPAAPVAPEPVSSPADESAAPQRKPRARKEP